MITLGNKLFILLLSLACLPLVWFGFELCVLGGSTLYLFSGVVLALTLFLTIRRSGLALWAYGLNYLVVFFWAIWESGWDGWALAPRLALFSVLGLWMLGPSYREHLGLPPEFPGS